MKVGRSLLKRTLTVQLIALARENGFLALDTETTGLHIYKDRPFSLIISTDKKAFYFNFQEYSGIDPDLVLRPSDLEYLLPLFNDPTISWALTNAKFDLHMLWHGWGIELAGPVWCTMAQERVINNDALRIGLDATLKDLGHQKSDTVEEYIKKHKLTELRAIPGKKQRKRFKFFDKVPYDIMVRYGQDDAIGTARVRVSQQERIKRITDDTPKRLRALSHVSGNEVRLTKTVFRMERVGIKIDREFCLRASQFETRRIDEATHSFKSITGRDFKSSPNLFADIFSDERDHWTYTDKGNPSFESGTLKKFKHPAASSVIQYRDAKSKRDFYEGFLYWADHNDCIHPDLKPYRAATGRFSSADPNLQNLKKDEDDDLKQEFVVRRAFIPRPGFFFIMPDYMTCEYVMMLDYAIAIEKKMTPLGEMVLTGADFHQATADLVKECGVDITRHQAKQGNFSVLYGAGLDTLAATLGTDRETARRVKYGIFSAAPEIKNFIENVKYVSEKRGFIFNWFGRRLRCSNPRYSYKMSNYLIQGGAADVNKVAMNRIDEYLLDKKSRLILCVHDENIVEVHESEKDEVPKKVHEIMESVYPYKYLPLKCDMEHSYRSLADKVKGYP